MFDLITESAVFGAASGSPIQYQLEGHPKQKEHKPEDHAIPEEEAYFARRHLIRAYCLTERFFDAMQEVLLSLSQYPVDFGVMYLYQQLKPEIEAIRANDEKALTSAQLSILSECEGDTPIAASLDAYNAVAHVGVQAGVTSFPEPLVVEHLDHAISYEEFNAYIRARAPVVLAAALATEAELELWKSLGDCDILLYKADDATEVQVEYALKHQQQGQAQAQRQPLGYGLSTNRGFVNYRDYLEKVYCPKEAIEHKRKKNKDSKDSSSSVTSTLASKRPEERMNPMSGQMKVDVRKYNYYVNTQIREDRKRYYRLRNERYVGAYFDQQPMFMQYVIAREKAKKLHKEKLIYEDHLSVEGVAAGMEAYEAELNATAPAVDDLYNSPVHLFSKELDAVRPGLLYKTTAELHQEAETETENEKEAAVEFDVWGNMADVNIWMGRNEPDASSTAAPVVTKSRLHSDPHDNLYTLVTGQKQFLLVSPEHAALLKTAYPTYAVAENGMSFRASGNIFLPWELRRNEVLDENFVNVVPPSLFSSDTINSHFSSLRPDEVLHYLDTNNIQYYQVELKHPGDRLFIPAGWFHQVTSTGA